jgi:hypothetical protein
MEFDAVWMHGFCFRRLTASAQIFTHPGRHDAVLWIEEDREGAQGRVERRAAMG